MNDRSDARAGFTVIELLVVSLLGLLILMASYQVLITNQRTYTVQAADVRGLQTVRAGMEILSGELREISADGNDIVAAGDSAIHVRSMKRLGIACEVDALALTPTVTVVQFERDFSAGDSVFVFADNRPETTSDDVWFAAQVTANDTTSTCNGREAQRLGFGLQQAPFLADTVLVGAPVRSFDHVRYGMTQIDGDSYLARSSGDALVPLVGPIDAADGVLFEYFDAAGNGTTTWDEVARINVTLTTTSEAETATGDPVENTITAAIYPRN